jgi:hypothetical protein
VARNLDCFRLAIAWTNTYLYFMSNKALEYLKEFHHGPVPSTAFGASELFGTPLILLPSSNLERLSNCATVRPRFVAV